jgi:hypothetical protein
VTGHDRRKILHFNVTQNPNAVWVAQQLREAWAYKQPHRFLLFDRDSKFGIDVISIVRDMGASQLALPFAVRGRTVLLSVGLEVADEIS